MFVLLSYWTWYVNAMYVQGCTWDVQGVHGRKIVCLDIVEMEKGK